MHILYYCRTMFAIVLCVAVLVALQGCSAAPTPTPTPPSTSTLVPRTATPPPPTPVGDYVPSDIFRCEGVRAINTAVKFDWPGIDNVVQADWLYYQCDQKPLELAGIYREKMVNPPFNWLENAWVELPQGTLGVYYHTAKQTWLYLWFIADASSEGHSNLVVAQRDDFPLELPCH